MSFDAAAYAGGSEEESFSGELVGSQIKDSSKNIKS